MLLDEKQVIQQRAGTIGSQHTQLSYNEVTPELWLAFDTHPSGLYQESVAPYWSLAPQDVGSGIIDIFAPLSSLIFIIGTCSETTMSVFRWLQRCVPGLSTLLLLTLLEYALQVVRSTYFYLCCNNPSPTHVAPVFWQLLFCAYSIFLHTLACLFPVRLSLAARSAAQSIWREHLKLRARKEQDMKTIKSLDSHKATMVIIIPSYKESVETMQDTLSVLANHQDAGEKYDVFLAMEDRDPIGVQVAQHLISEYSPRFSNIQYTVHPHGIAGESAGKSSNVSWAAKEVEKKYESHPDWKDVLVTVMDSDSHLLDQHFQVLQQRHNLTRQQGPYANFILYVPPIIFDRNAHLVPRMVRVADLMWCGAGLSCYGTAPTGSHVAIPTAVYTVSLPLVRLVNGWDAGPNAIGEDMHMMLKCYFATKGLLRIESLPSPASLCNVSTTKKGFRGWIDNHSARYTQGLRHMWGCLDTGYAIGQWVNMRRSTSSTLPQATSPRTIPRTRKLSNTDVSQKPSQLALPTEPAMFTLRNATVGLRMFEAHFLPMHLFVILIASAIFTGLPAPAEESGYLAATLKLTAYMRTMGFACMTIYFAIFYEEYHGVCVMVREWEMTRAGLYGDGSDISCRKRWTLNAVGDYFVFPVAGTLYGTMPLFQAEFSHFWTENLVYLVSAKPVRAIVDSMATKLAGVGESSKRILDV